MDLKRLLRMPNITIINGLLLQYLKLVTSLWLLQWLCQFDFSHILFASKPKNPV